jgi:hypothetical protein
MLLPLSSNSQAGSIASGACRTPSSSLAPLSPFPLSPPHSLRISSPNLSQFPLLVRTHGLDLRRTPVSPVVALTLVTFITNTRHTDRHAIIYRPRLQPAYHLGHRTPRSRSSCSVILTVCSGTPVPSSCVCFSCVSKDFCKVNVKCKCPNPSLCTWPSWSRYSVSVCLCLSLSVSVCLCLSLRLCLSLSVSPMSLSPLTTLPHHTCTSPF